MTPSRTIWNSVLGKKRGTQVTLECLPLFPLEDGDVKMDKRSTQLPLHTLEDDMLEDEPFADVSVSSHMFKQITANLFEMMT